MTRERKWDRLVALLRAMNGAVVALSGGVDSALLLRAASEATVRPLLAVTAVSPASPDGEADAARAFARSLGVAHEIIDTDEFGSPEFVRNGPDRCYHCKKELFTRLNRIAVRIGAAVVLEGANQDDLRDHRPGRRAAEECGVRSPLVEAGLTKDDIRQLARSRDLSVWNKPSLACLSSRIPYGTPISPALLRTVQAAEDRLHALGIRQVRVRHHGTIARIEIDPADFPLLTAQGTAERINQEFRDLGFTYVCLDLAGYRTGSMNERSEKGEGASTGPVPGHAPALPRARSIA